MKEFLKVLRRFVPPYKKYLVLTVVFNILSALLNIFSFMTIIPILNILFQTSGMRETDWIPWSEMTLSTCTDVVAALVENHHLVLFCTATKLLTAAL